MKKVILTLLGFLLHFAACFLLSGLLLSYDPTGLHLMPPQEEAPWADLEQIDLFPVIRGSLQEVLHLKSRIPAGAYREKRILLPKEILFNLKPGLCSSSKDPVAFLQKEEQSIPFSSVHRF